MNAGKQNRRDFYSVTLLCIFSIAMIAQVSLLFLLPTGHIGWLIQTGWVLFALSAILGWFPILAFRLRGRVPKGRSYIHTTQLVTSGLYAIVRHPQFLAWDFLAIAIVCITQHWGVYVAGGMIIVINHLTMAYADRDLIEKFAEPYRQYMEQVPQWNLFVGLWRWIRHRITARFR